jgi:hypothetical protein
MSFVPFYPTYHNIILGRIKERAKKWKKKLKKKQKEARKRLVQQFAAAAMGRGSKSTTQGASFSIPFISRPSSRLFLGLISLLEQNPDSMPCTYERIITSVSLGETGLLSAGRSQMWMQMKLSAHICINTPAPELN